MPDDVNLRAAEAAQPLNGLLLLLNLHQEARQAQTAEALRFLMVNQTRRLVVYRQAVFLALAPTGKARLEAVSNVAVPERDAPFTRWLEAVGAAVATSADARAPHLVSPADLPPSLSREWGNWGPAQALWLPLPGPDGSLTAALWIARDDVWTDGEQLLLEQLAGGYGHAWWALTRGGRRSRLPLRPALMALLAVALLGGALSIPVPQSTLAPAEVAPRDPLIVSAPLEGVIERFHVQPNEAVTAGQPLFSFESTVLRSRFEVARKALTSAEAELLTAAQGAFADPQSKARVAQLKAQVELRRAELAFARDLLDRVTVKADRAGIAVFTDVNDWLGKPVAVGERILTLADPQAAEIDIHVPVGDAQLLEEGADVSLFLNVDPLRPLHGRVVHASYEPGMTTSGILAYRVRAELAAAAAGEPTPRIGLRGTAKIEGGRVPLALYLFRRPLAALRQAVGI
ncbi:efflux RND transporter periplasmic adaptor subunit [Azospirillum canadense]|uniref:efflux RND transporter periplasmic adaptor subunit n=1 Tax=Azospirillum canadense TaxID=403962 RepID=UPI002227F589|nr:HlyD family efflux transporter periplasmic adaptor subunit [Azospirillum canadense]MCW2238368.1 multidrug resistance efflux pump [Azospirillum canadense]